MQTELDELQHHPIESAEKERLRIAQDLHDGPIQDLYAAAYQLQTIVEEMSGRIARW
jgi:signal transduction histidine kinase